MRRGVILAGRGSAKGAAAVAAIEAHVPNARVRFCEVDLSSLASVKAFADGLAAEQTHLDVLINNAGIMTPPKRHVTDDGFELQLGTNYLGHFALTAHLTPLLKRGREPLVVSVSSVAARQGAINFEDLQAERRYNPMQVYSQSKLACLMFAFELERRSASNGWGVRSIAAHPGVARTNLLPNSAGGVMRFLRSALWFLFQPAAQGALPTLYAATSPHAEGGGYYGPDKLSETRGHPTRAVSPKQALDAGVASRLWDVSERLTRVSFA